MQNIYNSILKKKAAGKKQLAVLVDPDKFDPANVISLCKETCIDYFFVGGSLLTSENLEKCISTIKENCDIPVVLFPGNAMQINKNADSILLLSLISGRNPEMLIGNHVLAAPLLKSSGLEIIPTGYILIESGAQTTVSYISNTTPIPSDKPDIAMCTAMAGEMLGLKLFYMDAGSGAKNCVPAKMIKKVSENINSPLIVGGGIKTRQQAIDAWQAGADVIVIGNALEKNSLLITDIAKGISILN